MKLKKQLGLWDLIILGLVFIGPASAMNLYGVLTAKTNNAATLVYILALSCMALTVYSYYYLSKYYPSSGSIYIYASRGLSPRIGFLIGWMLLLDYLFLPAVCYLFTGIALNAVYADIPIWLGTAVAVVITTVLNILGIKKVALAALVILSIELICLLLVLVYAVYIICNIDYPINWFQPFYGNQVGIDIVPVIGAVSIAMMSFLGFDSIATFSEESKGDSTQVGKAMIFCLLIAGVLFIVQIYLAALLPQISLDELKDNPASWGKAYFDIVQANMGDVVQKILAIVKMLGAAFAGMVAQAAASRLLFSMGRNRDLFHQLVYVHEGSGSPRLAILLSAIVNLGLAVCAAIVENGLGIIVSFIDIGALVAFVALHVSLISLMFVKNQKRTLISAVQFCVVPLMGIAILTPVLLHTETVAKIMGCIWLSFGIVYLVFKERMVHDTNINF